MVNRNDIRSARPENSNFNTRQAFTDALSAKKYNTDDDVIGSLVNSYENKRARQVSEWETLRVRLLRRAIV
ncbi:MAG: hypothetical protein H0X08_03715 [Blastocatellia bacterium]|nr:hypothetical protein [Blastocatellia bacterium]